MINFQHKCLPKEKWKGEPVMLNRIVFMSLIIVTSGLGIAKVALPLFVENTLLAAPVTSESNVQEANIQTKVDDWKVEWIASELIPSAEAAEGMTLDEEQKNGDGSPVKVMELREKQQQLNAREKALNEREGEISAAESRAQDKIAQLEKLELKIQAILDEEKSIKDKKIKRLTAVYEGMKAERAAPVIASMEMDIVVKIFSRMNEKQVGKILSFLPPKKAVTISQALTKRISSVK